MIVSRRVASAGEADLPLVAAIPDRWAAIWQLGDALVAPDALPDPARRAELTLCLELTMPPLRPRGALRLWQGAAEPGRALGLYALPDGALRLVHGDIDLSTAPDFGRPGETLSLRYRSCARGRGDIADFVNHDRAQRHRGRAGLPTAARLDEVLPRDDRFLRICHVAAIAEFGLAPTDMPALADGAMVATTAGPCPVALLRPGAEVLSVGGAELPLRWVERRARLCLGRQAPVLLRAPYFGLHHDLCVTPQSRVMRSGPTVEYLFGEERVLVRAGDMIASRGACRDRRRPVRVFHHLMCDDHACVAIDDCGVETALLADVVAAGDARHPINLVETDRVPCLPALDRAGAQALVAASARGRRALS